MNVYSVTVNDIEMEYFTFGNGARPFVILPGVAAKSVMLSAKAIAAAYRMFGEEYTVYVFDRRSNMPADYTVRQMAADTAAVMRQIGISGADIFGASQGGMIALCIAIDAPDLVHKMVIGSSSAQVDDASIRGIEKWIELAKSGDMPALTEVFIDTLYSANTIGKYKEMLLHINDDVSRRDIERFIIQAKAIRGFDVYDELEKIACPVLVIGVEGDRALPCDHSVRMAEKMNCELYLYGTEYGHCAFDEAPDYKERMMDFFMK